MDKIFFHIDVNSAFLSWTAVDELNRGNPIDLRTVPSIVGGDREKRRGIVLAKSIPARKFGIETAEPVASALRKCPDLIIVPGNHAMYRRMSNALMDYLHSLSNDIEQASIDECYMDFTPISHMYESPIACADMIRHEVFARFGFTVNVGISDKKVLAKMASDFQKPDKTHTLFSNEIQKKMWPLPVGDLFLCGKSAVEILRKLDIKTIGDLANADLSILTSHLKSHGQTLWEFANGIDDSDIVTEPAETKGIGNSTTLPSDLTDREEASRVLFSLCESVSNRLNKAGVLSSQITVEIKYATFKSVSHQTGVPSPIGTAKAIHETAMILFDTLWNTEPIRLLGVRAGKLTDVTAPVQLSIFDMASVGGNVPTDSAKQKKLEDALRNIRGRYGNDAVKRGSDT